MKRRPLLTKIILLGVLAWFAWVLYVGRDEVDSLLTGARWDIAALSIVVLTAANAFAGVIYASCMGTGSDVRKKRMVIIGAFLLSQLAKYLPGRIWGIVMQVGLLDMPGASARVLSANLELVLANLIIVTGVGVAALCGVYAGTITAVAMLSVFAVIAAGALRYRLADRFIHCLCRRFPSLARRLRLDVQDESLLASEIRSARSMDGLRSAGLLVAYAFCYALGWGLLIVALLDMPEAHAFGVLAVMSLSHLVGVVSLLPGGVGARELSMVLLAPAVESATSQMVLLAAASRAAILLVDAVGALIGWGAMAFGSQGSEHHV
ncbi:flippase-like domain-containing protein [Pseudoxanthomonas sp. LjRoot125]|uniref:lysylphosphatidylglycerol synthase domain-containing protein n=1 Tax=Pseudoxanthomonas sp. LjRoot125 TaxID=3342258 RepID=UPI003E11B397